MEKNSYKSIIETVTSIDIELSLIESLEQLFFSIKKQNIFKFLSLSISIIDSDEISFNFGETSKEFTTTDSSFFKLDYTQSSEFDISALALIINFIENRVQLHIERSKVTIIQECDSLFDGSLNSAYGAEKEVLNFLKTSLHLQEARFYQNSDEYPTKYTEIISKLKNSDDRFYSENASTNIVIIKLEISDGTIAGYLLFTKESAFNSTIIDLLVLASEVFDTNVVQTTKAAMFASRYKKYVGNSEVLDILIKNPTLLDIRREDVVIMSVDLVNSTKFASTCDNPIEVFDNISFYLDIVAKIVTNEYQGTLDKYIGDEVMAIFGAPIKKENYILDAINCAKDILKEIKKINNERIKNNLVVFDVKVSLGLAKDVVVGEIGTTATQVDYTAIGDGVNRLFRMTSHGKADTIIVNEDLKNSATNESFTLVDEVMFKGIATPEKIYKLEI